MAWLRTDDQAPDHPKVLRSQSSPRPPDLVLGPEGFACAVFGAVSLAAAWSAGKLQDGWLPESLMRRVAGRDADLLAKSAVRAGMFTKRQRGPLGEFGWYVNQEDELLHMRTSAEVNADRDRSRVTRQIGPTRLVRLRDGDQCRYCGKSVNWADRRSARGGTYDHPDPADRDVFVVACFGCNRSKAERTPEQAGMPLLPVPDVPLIGPDTAQRFSVPQQVPGARQHGADAPARPLEGADATPAAQPAPGPAAAHPGPQRSGTTRAPEDLDLSSQVPQICPRRDGSGLGRDGPGSGGTPRPSPRRSSPRGGRGRGRRTQPPTTPDPED